VRLTAASDAAIRFEVLSPAPRFLPLPDSGGTKGAVRLELEGFQSGTAPGAPELPGCIVALAVPPLGEVRVSATESDAEVFEGLVLVAAAEGVQGQGPGAAGARPGLRAQLLGVGWMRNQRVARVAIYPADYDAGAGRLTLHRRVDVAVQVEPSGSLGPPAESLDPFEGVYREALLNYEQGRSWRRPATRRLPQRAALQPERLAAFASAVPETSVYAGRYWIKIAVTETGFYKVSFNELRKFSLFAGDTAAARSDSLRLFNWPGVPVLPEDSYCDSCDFREVAIGVVDGADSLFSQNSDEFYFFAMGPDGWASLYDPASPETLYINHPYETANYYYLTRATAEHPVGGSPARIGTGSGAITNPALPTPASFPARVHYEEDNEYYPDASPLYLPDSLLVHHPEARRQWYSWEKWYWKSLSQGGSFTVTKPLPAAVTTQVWLRALTWGLSLSRHILNVSFNGAPFPTRTSRLYEGMLLEDTLSNANTTGNAFTLSVPSHDPATTDAVGLAWWELYYQRAFEPVDDELEFDSPDSTRDVIYRVGPFTRLRPPRVFDVTQAGAPFEIVGAAWDTIDARCWLRFQAQEESRRRYRVIQDSLSSLSPQSFAEAPLTSLENLRSSSEQADYIVVYYDGFKPAADRLVAWRSDHLALLGVSAPYRTKAVPVSALYDQFSGGRVDPAALRNFLRAAFYNWNGGGDPRRPAYVTFLGGASYDFKNIKGRARPGQPGVLVPSYENNFDGNPVVMKQFATDDWLLNVDNARVVVPDLYGGRFPVDDAATALAVVNSKVVGYEGSPTLGEWRNRVMLIADDNMQSARADPLSWDHLLYTSVLDALLTPPHMDRCYVYLNKYPTTPSYTKPEAKADIKRNLDEGVALVNFVGHGSPFQLADEKVLLNTDIGTLTNAPRFAVFIAASCDVGKFSDPVAVSLGQALISNPGGGAAGVISSTELAFSDRNSLLNQAIFRGLFRRDTVDCQYHVPLAAALLATKAGAFNEQKYQLMGDAAIGISLPRLWVDVTLADSSGNPVSQVRRGQTLTVRGRVRTCPGGDPVSLNGVASLLVEDSQEIGSVVPNWTYRYRAGAVYRGDVGLSNGEFSGRFIVPLEAREGNLGRVRAYVQGRVPGESNDTDGAGNLGTVVVPGEPPPGDEAGPRITLSFVGGSTTVRPDATLKIDLHDPSGILTTDHSPQNGIVVTLDENVTTRSDVTGSFRYAADSYQSGTAFYQLSDAPLGSHTLTVSAADNMAAGLSAGAHRSKSSLDFTVVEEPGLSIAHAYLFPNPTESKPQGGGGQFVVDAPGDSVNLLLRIYTASGRLIRTLKAFGGLGQVQVPWDGLDDEGYPVANGVYFFRVHVNSRDPDGTSSPRQKADADGRFVIVNRR
jgi:hypothetical protein